MRIDETADVNPPSVLTRTPAYLRAQMLCQGVRTSSELKEGILDIINPKRIRRAGLGYGAYVTVEPTGGNPGSTFTVNADIASSYANDSPLELRGSPDEMQLYGKNDQLKGLVRLAAQGDIGWMNQPLPSGKKAGEIVQAHGPTNLTTVIGGTRCALFDSGDPCKFCTLDGSNGSSKTADDLIAALEVALESKSSYGLVINMPFLQAPMAGLSTIHKITRVFPQLEVALETVPFSQGDIYTRAVDVGIKTLMMNLECYDEEARERLCPGKARLIPRDQHLEGLALAVEAMGDRGSVTSCLIAGSEPVESSIAGAKKLVSLGVKPEIIPLRLYENHEAWMTPTRPEDLLKIQAATSIAMMARGLSRSGGCLNCGLCSA